METRSARGSKVRLDVTLEGESKQEAKTLAALDAIRILENKPAYKNEMMCLLQRLEKKVTFHEETKPRVQPSRVMNISDILEQASLTQG